MANEFVINGLFLYRQYDEQVYIEHPKTNPIEIVVPYAGKDYLMSIDSFVYRLYKQGINIYYIFYGIPLDRLIKLHIQDDNYILYPNVSKINKFYIPYPLPDSTLEAERQAILNEYILTNNI